MVDFRWHKSTRSPHWYEIPAPEGATAGPATNVHSEGGDLNAAVSVGAVEGIDLGAPKSVSVTLPVTADAEDVDEM